MPVRDPVLGALGLSALVTVLVLLERRWRGRRSVLDAWAERHGLICEKDPPLTALSQLEPLALVPPVVAIERLIAGVLQAPPLVTSIRLCVCMAGNDRPPRRYLIGIFESHVDLPALRVVPVGDREAPGDLGFAPHESQGLPPGWIAEAFAPQPPELVAAIGGALSEAPAGFRLELRPGRMILVAPSVSVTQVNAMVSLQLRLQQIVHALLNSPPASPAPQAPPAPTPTWLN